MLCSRSPNEVQDAKKSGMDPNHEVRRVLARDSRNWAPRIQALDGVRGRWARKKLRTSNPIPQFGGTGLFGSYFSNLRLYYCSLSA